MDKSINAIIKKLENAIEDIHELTERYQNEYHFSSRVSVSLDSIEQTIKHLETAKNERYRKDLP